jgi:hypothetical protein
VNAVAYAPDNQLKFDLCTPQHHRSFYEFNPFEFIGPRIKKTCLWRKLAWNFMLLQQTEEGPVPTAHTTGVLSPSAISLIHE